MTLRWLAKLKSDWKLVKQIAAEKRAKRALLKALYDMERSFREKP